MFQYPDRKPNRLPCYDYSLPGWYFITICTKDKQEWFGKVIRNKMLLNKYGKIAKQCWQEIPNYFDNIIIDVYQIMPNHIHGIIIILMPDKSLPPFFNYDDYVIDNRYVGTSRDLSLPTGINNNHGNFRNTMLISRITGIFKMQTSKRIHKLGGNDFVWQRSFYDEIIRNERSLYNIRNYIINNPINWDNDRNNINSFFV